MSLASGDLFESWRLLLGTVCTVYAAVITARSAWGWIAYLSGPDRVSSLMRHYTVVQLLRIRLRRFTWEFVQIGFWLLLLLGIISGHHA